MGDHLRRGGLVDRNESYPVSEGWVCPVCGGVNGPMVARCPCNGNRDYGVTTSTSTSAHKTCPHEWCAGVEPGYYCRLCGETRGWGGFPISKGQMP